MTLSIDLWVDDEREAPEGWERADTIAQAIDTLAQIQVRHLSLDYVMGRGKTTDEIMYWLKDHPDRWPTGNIVCHSSSRDAQKLIEEMISDFAP